MGWWETLISVADFPARWHCGRWTEAHGWLHILSDLGVASAYFTIPCLLAYFVFRKKDVPFRKLFFLFSAFILFCGSTHLMEAVIFWWPAYRLAGLLKLATAIVSWTAVFALAGVVPQALRLRSPEELEREIEARKLAELHLQHLNEELERRVAAGVADFTAANVTLRAEREWFRLTLTSIGDAVITTDVNGRVTSLNSVAAELTGWSENLAEGQPLPAVFQIVNATTRQPVENPALRALADGIALPDA